MSTTPLSVAVIGAGMAGTTHANAWRQVGTVFDLGLPPVRLHTIADAYLPLAEDAARGSGASRIAVLHRTGHAEVGDVALGAAVSAAHRKEALRVLEDVVEKVKLQLPVWKRQFFADGTSEWTGAV